MSKIGSNTSEMRVWTNTVGTKAEDFNSNVTDLYNKINMLLSTDYKGGVSDSFNQSVLELKPFFDKQYETLNEFCTSLNTAADRIDEDQARQQANAGNLGI